MDTCLVSIFNVLHMGKRPETLSFRDHRRFHRRWDPESVSRGAAPANRFRVLPANSAGRPGM